MKPQPKVVAGGVGSMFAVVLVWVLAEFGVDMPSEVAVAVAGCISFAAAYLKA